MRQRPRLVRTIPTLSPKPATAATVFCLAALISVVGCTGSLPAHSPEPPSATAQLSVASTPAPSVTPSPTPTSRQGTFTASGKLEPGQIWPTAALLKNGQVLVLGLGAATLFDPATGRFASTGTPIADAYGVGDPDLTVALADGRALAFFPWDVQLYDPTTGRFGLTGSEGSHKADAAVVLSDGHVLALGGSTGDSGTKAADIYYPATGKFSRTGSMTTSRQDETATLLRDGRVLVTGGDQGPMLQTILSSAELYDPKRGKWTRTGSMSTPRYAASATLLHNGEVLVAGGINDEGANLASAELYDPTTGRFTETGSMTTASGSQITTLLPDDRVLVIQDGGTAEVYDPSTGTFSETGSRAPGSSATAAFALSDGRVVVIDYSGYADFYWP